MTVDTHPLVESYVQRLRTAADQLGPDQRTELVAEIRTHIADAVAELVASGTPTDIAVREVLDRVGSPEEIVRSARADLGLAPDASPVQSGLGAREITAVVLLPLGGFLLLVGWVVGVVLLWTSPRWTVGEKLLGTFVWPLGLVLPGAASLLVVGPPESCTTTEVAGGVADVVCTGGSSPLATMAGILFALAPVLVAVYLAYRGSRRAVPVAD